MTELIFHDGLFKNEGFLIKLFRVDTIKFGVPLIIRETDKYS